MTKKICIISLSQIAQDGRVLRQIDFLSRHYMVTVVGYGNPPEIFANRSDIKWIPLPLPAKFLGTIQRIWERFFVIPFIPKRQAAYKVLATCDCDAIHVNNWDALPMAVLAAKKRNIKMVLDIHESYDSWYWGLNAGIIKFIFRKYAREVDASSTVVKELATLHHKFGLDPIIVMNVPSIPPIRSANQMTDPQKIRLVHHGVASPARRTDLMIQTMAFCDSRYELHMVLTNINSKYAKKLKKMAEELAPKRVFFYPPYPSFKIVEEISKFDIGFYPLPPTSYNNSIALPNKLFEFIAAGLAVAIGPSTNMADIVSRYHCGVIAPSFDPRDLSKTLNNTASAQWDEMKRASREATKVLNAENEMAKVLDIYKKLLDED